MSIFQSKMKTIGEHASVAEELLQDVPDTEQKCRAIEQAVSEGYLTLEEALRAYKISPIVYAGFVLLQSSVQTQKSSRQSQFMKALSTIAEIYNASSSRFDDEGKKAIAKINRLQKAFK